MRAHATERAKEFSNEAITRRWIEVLRKIAEGAKRKPRRTLPPKMEMALKLIQRREYGGFGVGQFLRDLRQGRVS